MAISPSTDLKLLKGKLELTDDNQLSFANATAQFNYFNSLPKIEEENFSYQRKDGIIRFPAHIDTIIGYNYVMYRNTNYANKWFYAFIEDMTYSSDGVTLIKIREDSWQTWQFDLNFGMSWIDREHTNDDTIGSNLIDENLELGEYVINESFDVDYTGSTQDTAPFVAIGVTELPTANVTPQMATDDHTSGVNLQNRLPSGLTYLITNNYSDQISTILSLYAFNSKQDAVQTIFPIPNSYINNSSITFTDYTIFGTVVRIGRFNDNHEPVNLSSFTSYPLNSLNGYTPKNNKLKTYPFMYEKVSNNGGTEIVYHFEDFTNREAKFNIIGALTPSMSIKLYPINYMNVGNTKDAYNYGITGQKLPTASWNTDYYISWLNQQGQNLAIQTSLEVAKESVSGFQSLITGGFSGAVNSGLSIAQTIADSLQKKREAELVPQQSKGNINSGDVNFSARKSGFTIQDMSIKAQFARSIDDYFTMFGYKTNRTKTPNIYGRRYWNYIKTVGLNVTGDVPQTAITEIKRLFDNGITIWHDPSAFLNYNLTNSII